VSRTVTTTWALPERWGLPPSLAVMASRCVACCSRSRGLSSTSSGYLLPSPRVCISRRKWSWGLRA
uniref:Uncharacterized protein n=1 Tax=Varanus komodoensis TaxID=61221 RepID=A0A8D2JIA8_VARKO